MASIFYGLRLWIFITEEEQQFTHVAVSSGQADYSLVFISLFDQRFSPELLTTYMSANMHVNLQRIVLAVIKYCLELYYFLFCHRPHCHGLSSGLLWAISQLPSVHTTYKQRVSNISRGRYSDSTTHLGVVSHLTPGPPVSSLLRSTTSLCLEKCNCQKIQTAIIIICLSIDHVCLQGYLVVYVEHDMHIICIQYAQMQMLLY